MVTESGKHHFTCHFRTTDIKTGQVISDVENFMFVSETAKKYIERSRKLYGAKIKVEFIDVKDLDA